MGFKKAAPRVIIYKKIPDKKGHLSHKNAPGPHFSSHKIGNRSFSVKYQPGNHSPIRPPFLNHYYSGKVLVLRSQMTQKKQSKKKKLQRQMM